MATRPIKTTVHMFVNQCSGNFLVKIRDYEVGLDGLQDLRNAGLLMSYGMGDHFLLAEASSSKSTLVTQSLRHSPEF